MTDIFQAIESERRNNLVDIQHNELEMLNTTPKQKIILRRENKRLALLNARLELVVKYLNEIAIK